MRKNKFRKLLLLSGVLFLLIFTSTMFIGCGTTQKISSSGNNNQSAQNAEYFQFTIRVNAGNIFYLPTAQWLPDDGINTFDWIIDWGDGSELETVSGVSNDEVIHLYTKAGDYSIKIYYNGENPPIDWLGAFGFGYSWDALVNSTSNKQKLISIDTPFPEGSRCITGYPYTFVECENLISVPENLFGSICNAVERVFEGTFSDCTSFNSPIKFPALPNATSRIFAYTFDFCRNFDSLVTFPSELPNATGYVFFYTFNNCNSFAQNVNELNVPTGDKMPNFTGPISYLFSNTKVTGSGLNLINNSFFNISDTIPTSWHVFMNCTELSDYDDLPADWK